MFWYIWNAIDEVKVYNKRQGETAGAYAGAHSASAFTGHPLHAAVAAVSPEDVRRILTEDPRAAFQVDEGGQTALHLAIHMSLPAMLRMMVALVPAAARAIDRNGMTPMHVAARGGCLASVDVLLGCSRTCVWDQDSEGNTPLHLAAAAGRKDIVHRLLEVAPFLSNVMNNADEISLHLAALGYINICMKRLCGDGDDARCLSAAFALCHLIRATSTERLHTVGRLLDCSWALLRTAVYMRHENAVRAILSIDPAFAQSRNGTGGVTALHVAACEGNPSIMRALLSVGGDILALATDASMFTPLHCAASSGSAEAVELLLAVAPQMATLLTSHGDSALILAIENDNFDAAEMLVDAAPEMAGVLDQDDPSSHPLAMALGHRAISVAIKILAAAPETAAIPFASGHMRNSLHFACDYGDVDLVAAILQHCHADIASSVSAWGMTPLHYAVRDVQEDEDEIWVPERREEDALDITRMLLRVAPSTAMVGDSDGLLPLHLAARQQQLVRAASELVRAAPASLFKEACGATPFETSLRYFDADSDGDMNEMALMLLRAPGQLPQTLLEALEVRGLLYWRLLARVMSWQSVHF